MIKIPTYRSKSYGVTAKLGPGRSRKRLLTMAILEALISDPD
jgi:hypothetical protein